MIDYSAIHEIEIEFTTLCNAKCPLCYRNYKAFATPKYVKPFQRDFNDAIQQLDKFDSLDFVMLVGSLSEPTLYCKFIDIVKYLKRRGISLEICTNGDTHDKTWWKTLGECLNSDDKVYFTICGSTQELHSRYRKNTNLERILQNAAALRSAQHVDYAQCIRFNYNSDDFDSNSFKSIVSKFSNVYMTETFYYKPISNYIEQFNQDDFKPCQAKAKQYAFLKKFVDNIDYSKLNAHADCMSMRNSRIQIDAFGNIYPCYLFLESSNGNPWDMDMSKIQNLSYDCCKYCDRVVQMYAKKHRLEYII